MSAAKVDVILSWVLMLTNNGSQCLRKKSSSKCLNQTSLHGSKLARTWKLLAGADNLKRPHRGMLLLNNHGTYIVHIVSEFIRRHRGDGRLAIPRTRRNHIVLGDLQRVHARRIAGGLKRRSESAVLR